MKQIIVTITGQRGQYEVKFQDEVALRQYLKALEQQAPYFKLVSIKTKY